MSPQAEATMTVHEPSGTMCLDDEDSPALDPYSKSFNYEAWSRHRLRQLKECPNVEMGVAFRDLNVHGFGSPTDYQKTFADLPSLTLDSVLKLLGRDRNRKINILQHLDGLVKPGEMLLVLGRPGSGCSTFLKTLAGHTHGLYLDTNSQLNYHGISVEAMRSEFHGECTYQAESDTHFPHLTVGQTLSVAANARTPKASSLSLSRISYSEMVQNATASALGLLHVMNTKMGSDFVRGISGGERKRASIAEILVGNSPLQCWDNSTRGLDSANALEFVKILRATTKVTGSVAIVTLYQASQNIYDVFDKVLCLYEGRQIYFGNPRSAQNFFVSRGFECPDRTTTSDFLTALTNPAARSIQSGYEASVPRTPDDFARVWDASEERAMLLDQIEQYNNEHPIGGTQVEKLRLCRKLRKAGTLNADSPYTISLGEQIKLCTNRGFQRLFNDLTPVTSGIAGNAIVSIILGTMFFDLPEDTSSFFSRGVLLYFSLLLNTFLGAFEGVALWDQRPIVEKHHQLAYYHPFTEAVASMFCDLPNKFLLITCFNIPFYFLANLRRTPGAFFVFYLFAFISLVTGSMIFRTIGSMSRTLTASITPGAVFIFMLVIYTSFMLPIPDMHPWLRWFGYIDPIAYAFESLMVNEFDGRDFPCTQFVPSGPSYMNATSAERQCTTVGSVTGDPVVAGGAYIGESFQFYRNHLWRNFGIIIALMLFLCVLYLLATEFIAAQKSKGEVLVFRRGKAPADLKAQDEEAHNTGQSVRTIPTDSSALENELTQNEPRAATFVWDSLSYDVKTKDGMRRLLDDVEGWVEPGKLTALMGASGAGKTTLLNVLANRTSTGVIGADQYVNVDFQDSGFARKVGYAQQQDLHLSTSTVREALEFSALMRQSSKYSRGEKLACVDEVIETLGMGNFADAIIGVPGEGLNVEQRKRVTIGVELAARPELLLFLDEPTSGLDSDTAWAICKLLRKLADNGQAILCTIHQPSGTLFEMFDRLLFLVSGKSIYFGDIGKGSKTLVEYFESRGARSCGKRENPAEWLLEITGSAPGSRAPLEWSKEWKSSAERQQLKERIEQVKHGSSQTHPEKINGNAKEQGTWSEFATPFPTQLWSVTARNFQRDWRTPSYLYSKLFLTLGTGLVNGFSFYHSDNSVQGIQNQIFSIFLMMLLFSNLDQLIMPQFIESRSIYEIREGPSRTYSWVVFIVSNIISEIPWQTLMAVILFVCWYYPVGMYRTALATGALNERGGLVFLLVWSYMIFSSTFSQAIVAAMPDAMTAINIASTLFSLSLIFCGVLISPSQLPHFWIFMYRVNPVTYFVGGIISPALSGIPVVCSAKELMTFDPPLGKDCATYLADYMLAAGGSLLNPNATTQCQFCPVADTDTLLRTLGVYYSQRWRDFGISLVYSVVNLVAALGIYWLARVPKRAKRGEKV